MHGDKLNLPLSNIYGVAPPTSREGSEPVMLNTSGAVSARVFIERSSPRSEEVLELLRRQFGIPYGNYGHVALYFHFLDSNAIAVPGDEGEVSVAELCVVGQGVPFTRDSKLYGFDEVDPQIVVPGRAVIDHVNRTSELILTL